MKTLLPTLLILLFSITTDIGHAQHKMHPDSLRREHPKISGYYICGGGGYTLLSPSTTSSISKNLTDNGFAPMASDMGCWNITPFHVLVRNAVLEVDILGQADRNTIYGNSRTTTSGVGTRFELGYVLFNHKNWLIYPEAGFYTGSMSIHSHQGMSPVLDVSATNHSTAFDFSLNFDHLSSTITDRDAFKKGNLPVGKIFSSVIGISVGYTISPYYSFWNDNNIDIYNKVSNNVNFLTNVVGENSTAALSMFYVKLRIGFGASSTN